MELTILKIIFVIFGVGLFVSAALALYHFAKMMGEIDSKKNTLANIVPWAVTFIPSFLTKTGRQHQSRFVFFFLVGAMFAGGLFIIDTMKNSENQSDDILSMRQAGWALPTIEGLNNGRLVGGAYPTIFGNLIR